ncbi:MAG: hypothetical protein KDA42_05210, partial [Planctomycetales bacterium]|nr:hypothetical protein [Planctomycetales bacterium]
MGQTNDIPNKAIVLGGRRDPRGAETDRLFTFERALIAELDLNTGHAHLCHEYVSPRDVCHESAPSVLFKAGTLVGDTLYTCTETEVLWYRLPGFSLAGRISLPWMNDVHHVLPLGDNGLLVASTGLDMIVHMTNQGDVMREWDVCGEPLWARFSRDVDYRKQTVPKPRHAHPNYIFLLDGEIWATRCRQRDAVCLTADQAPIELGGALIHDGVRQGNRLYFTRVDGHLAVVDAEKRAMAADYNLSQFYPGRRPVGWCRGVAPLDEQRALVGFTRLRPTLNASSLG